MELLQYLGYCRVMGPLINRGRWALTKPIKQPNIIKLLISNVWFSIKRDRYYWNVLLIPYPQCCRCNTDNNFTITSWILLQSHVKEIVQWLIYQECWKKRCSNCFSKVFLVLKHVISLYIVHLISDLVAGIFAEISVCFSWILPVMCVVFQYVKAVLWGNCTDVFRRGSGLKFTSGPLKDWGESARAL